MKKMVIDFDWQWILTWAVSVLSLLLAGISIYLAQHSNAVSKQSYNLSHKAYLETQRPRIEVKPVAHDNKTFVQFKKTNGQVEFISQILVTNIGQTPAKKMVYSQISGEIVLLGKKYASSMPLINGVGVAHLGPTQDFYHNIHITVTAKNEVLEGMIANFLENGSRENVNIEISYKGTGEFENEDFGVTASYRLSQGMSEIISYNAT